MTARRVLLGFIAGFLATLLFHQVGLWLLHAAGMTDRTPFVMEATRPFGVPSVISLAFWGGVWGIILAALIGTNLRRAALFGAAVPTLVALFVVAPLKGQPLGGGWDPKIIAGGVLLNGLWGLGTALLLKAFGGRVSSR